jgi:hypothetical protein
MTTKSNSFHFVKIVNTNRLHKRFSYAIYADSTGNKAYAKICHPKPFNFDNYWLLNEISTYRQLQKIHFHTPTVKTLDYIDSSFPNTLLTKYLPYPTVSSLPVDNQARAIISCLNFLEKLNSQTHFSPNIIVRSRFYWLMLLPFIAIRALLRSPSLFPTIIGASLYLIAHAPSQLFDKRMAFVHRDLGPNNILVKNNRYWLADFQLACITHPVIEPASAYIKNWQNTSLNNFLFKKYKSDKSFNFFAVYFSLYDLSLSDSGPKEHALNCIAEISKLPIIFESPKDFVYSLIYSSVAPITISPFNKSAYLKATQLIIKIQHFSPSIHPHLIGSLGLKIAGKNDIDIFAECPKNAVSEVSTKLSKLLGAHPKVRSGFSEWQATYAGIKTDLTIIDPRHKRCRDQLTLFYRLKSSPSLITKYLNLKHRYDGLSKRDYTFSRMHFFNQILKGQIT